jgi:hypothetical protein
LSSNFHLLSCMIKLILLPFCARPDFSVMINVGLPLNLLRTSSKL